MQPWSQMKSCLKSQLEVSDGKLTQLSDKLVDLSCILHVWGTQLAWPVNSRDSLLV